MAHGIESGHRFLTEVAALLKGDRKGIAAEFLWQRLFKNLGWCRVAGLDPERFEGRGVSLEQVGGRKPSDETFDGTRLGLNPEAIRPLPRHSHDTHGHAVELEVLMVTTPGRQRGCADQLLHHFGCRLAGDQQR